MLGRGDIKQPMPLQHAEASARSPATTTTKTGQYTSVKSLPARARCEV